jgi:two-component system, LytTR family, sensor kinase
LKRLTAYSSLQQIGLFLAWWFVWTSIQTYIIYSIGETWQYALIDACVSNFILSLLCAATIIMYRYYQPGNTNSIYRLLFAIVIAFIYCYLLKWSILYLVNNNQRYSLLIDQSMPIRYVFAFILLACVTIINWLWKSLNAQKEQLKRNNDAEQLAVNAELERLRQQLQPHFLFNSLNSISALAGSKPEAARKMIQQLSDFLRGTMKKDEQKLVPFHEELNHLNLYLEIEKVRFGHRLNVDINCDEMMSAKLLPPLLLQPIVENAIKFGLYGTIGEITISIMAHIENQHLVITIKNPFDQYTESAHRGTGFGLSSINRRLFLLYARNDLMTTEKKGTTFLVTLKIPQTN